MGPDVIDIIIEYWRQVVALRELLASMRREYGFLESVQFETLDDVINLWKLGEAKLPGVVLIMFSPSLCGCRPIRDHGVWIYVPAITRRETLTILGVLDFARESGLLCPHERVEGLAIHEDSVHILTKQNEFGETAAAIETQRAGQLDPGVREQHPALAED